MTNGNMSNYSSINHPEVVNSPAVVKVNPSDFLSLLLVKWIAEQEFT